MKKRILSSLAVGVMLSFSLGSPALADVRVVTGYPTTPVTERIERLVDVNVLLPIGNVYDDSGHSGAVGHPIEMRKLIATPDQVNGMNAQELTEVPVSTTMSGTTDDSGTASFAGLEQGLWIMEPLSKPGDTQIFQTMVVDLPTLDNNGHWDYTVDLIAKPVPPTSPTTVVTTVTSPQGQGSTSTVTSTTTTRTYTPSPGDGGSGDGDGSHGGGNIIPGSDSGGGGGDTIPGSDSGGAGGQQSQQSPSGSEQGENPALTRLAETGASVIGLIVITIGFVMAGIALMLRKDKDKGNAKGN